MPTIEGLSAIANLNQGYQDSARKTEAYEENKLLNANKAATAKIAAELYQKGDVKGALGAMIAVDPSFAEKISPQLMQFAPDLQQNANYGQEKGKLLAQDEFNQLPTDQAEAKAAAEAPARAAAREDKQTKDDSDWATKMWGKVTAHDSFKNYQQYKTQEAALTNMVKNASAFGDIAGVFAFMKGLDPKSVVRDTEFATASEAGSLLDRAMNSYSKLEAGERLTPAQRSDMLRIVQHIGASYKDNYRDTLKPVMQQAAKRRIDISDIDPYSFDEVGNPALKSGGHAPLVQKKPAAPKAGEIIKGFKFKGGNPADQKNWEKQ